MAGKIIIDTELCKGCGLCVAVCPNNSIVISERSNKKGYFPAEPSGSKCTGCAACAAVCPEAAIEVQRDDHDQIKAAPKSPRSAAADKPRLVEGRT